MEVSRLWIFQLLMLLCIQVPITESTATLTIFFQGFQNSFERLFDGQCCDTACDSGCDLLYRICFNDSSPQPQCLTTVYNVYSTSNRTLTYNLDSWQGNLPVKVLAYDIDSGRNEFIDYFIFTLNISSVPGPTYSTLSSFTSFTSIPSQLPTTGVTQLPGPGNSSLLVFPGIRQYFGTNLRLNAVVTCDANYYTQRCDVYCLGSDTCSGHYTCDLTTGQKVCLTNWTGSDCTVSTANAYCTPPATPPTNEGIGPCQLVDLVFILDSSGSINNLDQNNWQYMKNFIKSVADRVNIGRNFFQLGVVTFGDSAQLSIKLSDGYVYSSLQNKIDALPYLGQKTNLRSGLRLARTEAFLARNGARPNAYQSVVLVYDGEKPTAEFGTLVDEAPRLKEMGIDVSVVSLNYFFTHGLATLDLVQNISSQPLNTHLFYNLDSWSRLSNTIAPTILANLVNTCLRNIGTPGSGTGASTIATALPTSLPSQTRLPSSTTLPTNLPASSSRLTTVPSSFTNSGTSGLTSILLTIFTSTTSGAVQATDQFCSYRGTCSSGSGINVCCCQPGYVGVQCEYEDDPCAGNPCNGGSCFRINRLNFTCSCLPGFSGNRCQIVGSHIFACDTPPPTSAPPQCSSIPPAPCTEFYYGTGCTTFCREEDTCLAHYSCNSSGQKTCLPGWRNVAANCTESDGSLPTECPSTCLNGGFCFVDVCCCPSGFHGEFCEIGAGSTPPSNSTTPTGFTGLTSSSAAPTGLTLTSPTPTGLTPPSSATPTGLIPISSTPTGLIPISSTPTGLTSSAAAPTGLTSSSPIPTGLTSTSPTPTGLTPSSATPTGLTSISAAPTGLTSSSPTPTGLTPSSPTPTGLTPSSATPTGLIPSSATPTGLLPISSTPTGLTLSSPTPTGLTASSASTLITPTLTSPSTSTSTSTATSTTTATTTTPTTTGTTLSQQEQLIRFLRDYIRNNFPNLSPVEQQQLLNQLLSQLVAPSALSVDDINYLPPIYISLPWPGTGKLANYTIQLEVLQAFLIRGENSTFQLKLKYDYILTAVYTGNVTRVTPEEYQRLMYEVDDVSTDVSLLDSDNRLQIVVYGSQLDSRVWRKFAVALRNAYGQLNSAWTGKSDARIVIGDVEELIALTGEDLTLLNFWLVSGSSDSESPNSITVPSDLSITTELSNLGVVTSLYHSGASFKVIDGYSLYVKGVVYYEDMYKFSEVLLQYWNNTVGIASGYTVKVIKQDKCYFSNGLLVTQLIYFVYNSTSFGILPKSLAFTAPTSEQLPAVTSVDGSVYELVPTADSANALPLKQAFFITVLDHPVETTFSAIQMPIQERIQEVPSYTTAEVKVFGADEYFSVNKRISFSRIFWFLFNNGTVVDGRYFMPWLPTMVEWSILLQDVKLPNGRQYRFVTDEMSEDVVVPRSECFFQPVNGIVQYVESFEEALTMTVQKKKSALTNSASVVSAAFVEEYVNNTGGSTVSVIFFIIKSPHADSYFAILDASTIFSELISTNDLHSNMQLKRPDGSEYVLLNKTAVLQMTRYVSLFHLFLKQYPLTRDLDKFSTALTVYYKKKVSSAVNIKILTVEEFLDPDGSSFWGIGYSVSLDGTIVWPDTIQYANSSEMASAVDVVSATGNLYGLMLSDVESVARAKDLFSFLVTASFRTEDLKSLEKLIAKAFKCGFPEYFESVVETDIVSTEELLTPEGTSIFRIYYQLYVDRWPVSATNHDAINEYNMTMILANFSTSRLWSGDLNSLTEVSSLSAVVMNRVLFQEDLAKLELALKSAVAQALLNTGNSNDQFLLSVKRQQECITSSGSLEWSVDFSASLAGERLYPGLLPMHLVNVSTIDLSLVSSSVVPKYQLIDVSPPFLYDYEKGFRLLLNRRANSSLLSSFQTILTQGYGSVNPKSDVEVKVAAVEEVIIKINRPLIDMPSAWQVIYYVKVDGLTLNGRLDESLNASFINSLIAQSSMVDKTELLVLDTQTLEIVRVEQCLKLLFAGMVSSSDLMTIGRDVEASLQGQGIRNVSASALQRSEKISQDGRLFTEVRVSIMEGGNAVEGDLIRRVLPSSLPFLDTYISDPDSVLHVSLYEKSQLFSVSFKSPIIGVLAGTTLEKSLEQVHRAELQCVNASVRIVKQYESLNQSGSSIFVILYALMCDGIPKDARESNQSIDLDDLWVILSAAGFSSHLFEGDEDSCVPVDHLLGIPFTTYVSPLDYSVITQSLKQSSTALSLELSTVEFHVLDQRTYLDEQGNFCYMILCSALMNNTVLNGRDFLPLLNVTITAIEKVVGPAGSNYSVSDSDYSLFRPLQSAGVVYFQRYLTRNEESDLLFAIPKSVLGLEDKYANLTAQIFTIDRVILNETIHRYRYIIFLTSEVTPHGVPVDLALEPPINATILSAALTQPARTSFPAFSIWELGKSFRLGILGYVGHTDVQRFKQQLQILWNHSISECLVEEYLGVKGETVTGLSYFVLQNDEIIDPTSIQAPSANSLNSVVFGALPGYAPYTRNLFLEENSFCFLIDGDSHSAMEDWTEAAGSSQLVLKLLTLQPAFGLYGSPVTRVCYTASSANGVLLLPGRDPTPINNHPDTSETFVRADTLYSLTVVGSLTKDLIFELTQQLTSAWKTSAGNEVSVNVYGVDLELIASSGATLVTRVYYGVMFNGSMLRPIDRPAPSMDTHLRNLPVDLYGGETVKLRYLVLQDPRSTSNVTDKIVQAITIAWNIIPGNTVKVKIPAIPHQSYTDSLFGYVVKVYYAVTLMNDKDVDSLDSVTEPNSTQLSEQLEAQGLTDCACTIWHGFYLYAKDSAVSLRTKLNAISNALRKAWSEANPDKNQSEITIRVNLNGGRKKRTTDISQYEDIDGNLLSLLQYQVAVRSRDPDPLFVQFPNDSAVVLSLSEVTGMSVCTSCTLQQCGDLYISGTLLETDKAFVMQAIANAFASTNQPEFSPTDFEVVLKSVTIVKDSTGADVSRVSYCVHWTANSTLPELNIPSFDQMSKALIPYKMKQVDRSMIASGDEKFSYNTNVAIIAACCVGGFVLLVIVAVIIGRIIYQKRKLAEQDKQKLSISDGDSFVGHGLYNPSPYNSLHNKAGPVLTKLQFRESTGSDIANVADSSSFICLKKTDTPATFYNILR